MLGEWLATTEGSNDGSTDGSALCAIDGVGLVIMLGCKEGVTLADGLSLGDSNVDVDGEGLSLGAVDGRWVGCLVGTWVRA